VDCGSLLPSGLARGFGLTTRGARIISGDGSKKRKQAPALQAGASSRTPNSPHSLPSEEGALNGCCDDIHGKVASREIVCEAKGWSESFSVVPRSRL
jgi:hypothetical protein